MSSSFRIAFAATELGTREGVVNVMARLQECGLAPSDLSAVEIALVEAINNVVEHACADLPEGAVEIECQVAPRLLGIAIRDPGQPMPGLQVPAPTTVDLTGPRNSLPEGGFGWNLLHELTRSISYRRSDGHNHLNLSFDIGAGDS